jgi:hypothetical protein
MGVPSLKTCLPPRAAKLFADPLSYRRRNHQTLPICTVLARGPGCVLPKLDGGIMADTASA